MLTSVDPTTGRPGASRPELEPNELRDAVSRAVEAFDLWGGSPISARSARLKRAATLLREEAHHHAEVMAGEMGKPVRQGRAEVEKCAWVCEFYADNAPTLLADEPVGTDAVSSWVQYEPLGPVLAVMPWNFPYWQVFRCVAPALMAGNVVLLKHAANVQRCAEAIEDLLHRAELPRGVLQNLPISSQRVGELIAHPDVSAITLTGSEQAGARVAEDAGRALKKVVLELGGSDPFIVLDDARVAQVAQRAARARTINAGQSCIAAKRFLVPKVLERSFVEALQLELESLAVGDPREEATDIGPLARGDLLADLDRQVCQSIEDGAELVTGGRPMDREGYFYPPTLLAGVKPGMAVAEEETFGPVAAVIPVDGPEEAVRIANASNYGLGASVWCLDRERGLAVAERLDAGSVCVNGIVKSDPRLPFGGVKRSGYGRELGREGIHEFVTTKSYWVGEPA